MRIANVMPNVHERIVDVGMLGSSVFATADRTSGYGESSSVESDRYHVTAKEEHIDAYRIRARSCQGLGHRNLELQPEGHRPRVLLIFSLVEVATSTICIKQTYPCSLHSRPSQSNHHCSRCAYGCRVLVSSRPWRKHVWELEGTHLVPVGIE